jgi:Ca-activated chloride channel homolog
LSFLSPWRLLLLIAPAAVLAGYVLAQRRRRTLALRFSSVDLLASVMPRRSGWQRHAAGGMLIAAIAVLVVGFARPATAVRTPKDRATILLALDVSGSMAANDVAPSRLAAAKSAARVFVQSLPKALQVGLVAFDSSARVLVAPATDRGTVLSAVANLTAGSGTATGDAISLSVDAATTAPRESNGKPAPATIVLMSDGTPTVGSGEQSPTQSADAAAAAAKRAGVPVNTIAFGTQHGSVAVGGQVIAVPSDPAAMARLATEGGGRSFTAENARQLRSVYERIGRAVGYDVHQHEITAAFTGAGLVITLLAALSGLIWLQRIV